MNLVPQSSRRQFLAGHAAVDALQHVLDDDRGHVAAEFSAGQACLFKIGRTAMACDFDIFFPAGQVPGATEAAVAALDLVDALETQLTVYRPTSEVMEINRRAGREAVPVEPQLWQLLRRAQQLWLRTGGAFDITSGPLSKAWGFFRRSGRFPSPEEVAAALRRVGGDAIELDADAGTIRFSREGLEINLNAIGKGYALDRAAELLTRLGVQDFLIHGGQSSVLARGRRATGDAALSGWLINIAHPLRPDRRLAELRLIDQAVGTSGAGNQYFYFQGRRYGHVIDPRTGYPADQVLSVTIIAQDAATADAMATACYVLGVEASLALLATEPDCGAVFVVSGERAGSVRLITHGVDDQQLRVLGEESV